MRNLMRLFNRNLLLKVAGYNSIHIMLRIGIGAVMSWVLARLIGPSGMAVMGNLRNFIQGIQSFSVLGLENGLVSYATQYKNDRQKLVEVYGTAWIVSIVITTILSISIFLLAPTLDRWLIGLDFSYAFVFQYMAAAMPFYVIFILISSLLQGFEWYKKFVMINIIINILVFVASLFLIYGFGLSGALVAVVITPIIQCLVGFGMWKSNINNGALTKILWSKFEIARLKPLLSYSAMALISAVLIPVTYIAIRQDVRAVLGDVVAGDWEMLQRLSGYYMLFVTTLISLYVLPQLSKDFSHQVYRKTIIHFYKTILPPVALGLMTIYMCRELLVDALFTEEFNGMLPMFKWQLAGDFIKIITTVMAFRFIAINDLKRYFIAETVSLGTFYIANVFMIRHYGTSGVVMAYLTSYLFYAAALTILLRKELWSKN
ncbi:O-antigen translocase [Nonlabens antarcticus]|uniref:O-antigen translocase n=1 Tax=Nonlabens antarcticus TaxID=392714 RepID=UPI0018910596|nr:O-antigen translocase [Nonlabens antarcticus]